MLTQPLRRLSLAATLLLMANSMFTTEMKAQADQTQLPHYTGNTLSNPNRHDGALSPAVGVHNIQVMRANREHPSAENGNGWTYNHQPMLAYWQGRFWLNYLCDPKDEQVPPSHTLMQWSEDGYSWSVPQMLFPEYDVPEGFTKEGVDGEAHNLKAVMHQRVGWFLSKEGILLAQGYYGVCLNPKDHNNDGNGIGRVVRQVKEDGSLGPIYFIYYNHGFNEKNTDYPNYRKAPKTVTRACEELLANPRFRMQWVEESDKGDPIIPLNKDYKAYCDYTLPDGRLIAFWKHALTSTSTDGGNTWLEPVNRAKGFVNSNAKIWGQRLSDGSYATVYNPSEYRWPLGISLSADGLNYTTLNLVCGEVPPMRYGGNYKSRGPQYTRGILEGNGTPPDGNLWITYSMNKEDIWVGRVPVPVETEAHGQADGLDFCVGSLAELTSWNIYSPIYAPVRLADNCLVLCDADPFDYAKVERKIPATKELAVSFDIEAAQNDFGRLQVEFLDSKGTACSRVEIAPDGHFTLKGGARSANLISYESGRKYHVEARLSVSRRLAEVYVDGKKVGQRMFFAPVESIERVMFRTGEERHFPDIDTPADWYGTLDNAGELEKEARFAISEVVTTQIDDNTQGAFLKAADYQHYVDYFNGMEDENIVQAIPNSEAWQWMKENIPFFECSQQQFEQMYYYRWWTLRKHIEQTPVGWAMTEFLVQRNYADKWKLISSGVGHHIHESRWIRNPEYLDQIVETWFKGNDGKPMAKLTKYSSWIAQSLWERYLVDGRKQWYSDMLPSLEWEYNEWESTHRRTIGSDQLYWQEDVKDAMEETISGGRRKKYLRPSINAYMFGNAMAISNIARLAGDETKAALYAQRADTIRSNAHRWLWNEQHRFFETHRVDSSANVREAIGFMPWYTKMAYDLPQYAEAWRQVADSKGFAAPYGLTTAERRHPQFRTHGVGQCEWDGAVWPFATSQTLTALANFINDYPKGVEALSTAEDGAIALDSLYFAHMERYVQSQSMRGKPYIGEYLDEVTGYWLKGDQERSRYYNHSTFCDMMITGICGLRPREDNIIEVNPILPEGRWTYFCLDRVSYHGHDLTIIYDRDGTRYHAGKGLSIYVDGKKVANRPTLGKLQTAL